MWFGISMQQGEGHGSQPPGAPCICVSSLQLQTRIKPAVVAGAAGPPVPCCL